MLLPGLRKHIPGWERSGRESPISKLLNKGKKEEAEVVKEEGPSVSPAPGKEGSPGEAAKPAGKRGRPAAKPMNKQEKAAKVEMVQQVAPGGCGLTRLSCPTNPWKVNPDV